MDFLSLRASLVCEGLGGIDQAERTKGCDFQSWRWGQNLGKAEPESHGLKDSWGSVCVSQGGHWPQERASRLARAERPAPSTSRWAGPGAVTEEGVCQGYWESRQLPRREIV